jgi:class 3 adenylate cyclase/Tfp pilus assembly protein PilF
MKKAIFFFTVIACIAIQSFAQQQGKSKIDSLLFVLKTAKQDTAKVNTLNALADEFRNNDPDTALYFANQAQALAIKLNYKMGIANSQLTKIIAETNLGKYDEALKSSNDVLKIYDQLLPIAVGTEKTGGKAKILKQKARVYNSIGSSYFYQGNYPAALKNYSVSLKIREESGDKWGIANSYNNIGRIYADQGNYPEALKNYFASLKISKEIADKRGIAVSYTNIGYIYEHQGNYPEALENFLTAIKIQDETGEKKDLIYSYINLGNIYYNQGNYPEALKNYLASLKISEEIGDKYGISNSYSSIGSIFRDQRNYPEALKNYFASLKIREETGDKQGIANSYNNIGVIYEDQGNYPEALKNYFASLKIKEEIGNKQDIANSCINIGNCYIQQKKTHEASQYLNKGLSLSKEIGTLDAIKESYKGLATLDSAEGNFNQSLAHYKMYISTRDSIFSRENVKKIMQYEFDKKEALAKAEQENKDALALKELQKQKLVRNGFIGGFAVVLLFAGVFFRQRIRISKEKRKSDTEKKRSEELLLNILPYEVAEELKQTGHCQAKTFSMVTVMFMDFKDFTSVSEKVSAELLVDEINFCFSAFDRIVQKNKVEKIKTVGDAYICVSGLPVLNYTHAFDMVNAAIEIRNFMLTHKKEKEERGEIPFELRIGIHTGPVVAGIVGLKKFQYDIWGDTVNLAARMESSGEAGRVNISGTTHALVKDKFNCTHRGKIVAKNKGELDMYFVEIANPSVS